MTQKRQYAAQTTVPIGRSKEAIEAELVRLCAKQRAIVVDEDTHRAMVLFELADQEQVRRRYRIILPLPAFDVRKYGYTPTRNYRRSDEDTRAAWEQDCLARW